MHQWVTLQFCCCVNVFCTDLTYKARKELHKAARKLIEVSSRVLQSPLDGKELMLCKYNTFWTYSWKWTNIISKKKRPQRHFQLCLVLVILLRINTIINTIRLLFRDTVPGEKNSTESPPVIFNKTGDTCRGPESAHIFCSWICACGLWCAFRFRSQVFSSVLRWSQT